MKNTRLMHHNDTMSSLLLCIILCFLSTFAGAQDIPGFIQQKYAGSYHVDVQTKLGYYGAGMVHVDYYTGYFPTTISQTVVSQKVEEPAILKPFGLVDSCVYFGDTLGKRTAHGKSLRINQQYKIDVYDLHVNFDLIDSIYDYNPDTHVYKAYTASNKPFIDLSEPSLNRLSDSIWQIAPGFVAYARLCYEFVASEFRYNDPLTGFHPLSEILENGGGDCGNLSSVLVTLLRIKGIPARHIVGCRPDASLHVWAEFYLENYGWIPVDVTYKQEHPGEDYFGHVKFNDTGFVIHRDLGQTVTRKNTLARVPSLQTYMYAAVYSEETTSKVVVTRKIRAIVEQK